MGIKSLDELKSLRDKLKTEINVRASGEIESNTRVIVGMATCGIAAGARPVFSAMVDEARLLDLTHVTFVQSGCMGACHSEPTVEVRVPGKEPILYGNVTSESGREIIRKHIRSGELVQNLIIGRPFETV
jgi:NADP-reducing hydrogenase subunit HndB